MTLEQAIEKIKAAINAAEHRRNEMNFAEDKNITELHFAIDYALKPPLKTERKV
jgi:hypothetical protein